jgi:hypothetical protein
MIEQPYQLYVERIAIKTKLARFSPMLVEATARPSCPNASLGPHRCVWLDDRPTLVRISNRGAKSSKTAANIVRRRNVACAIVGAMTSSDVFQVSQRQ